MDGLALPFSELPLELIQRYALSRFVYERGGEREVRFLRQVPQAVLPVRHDGLLRIVSWGSRSGKLPRSGYTRGWRRSKRASGRSMEPSRLRFQPLPACKMASGFASAKACVD